MTWPWSRPTRQAPAFVDTPAGLLAADGTHYHTTEPLLREYADPVVEAVGLGTLLQRSGVWLRSPQTLTALLLPILLLVLPWWAAAGVSLLFFALWSAAAPGLVATGLIGTLKVLEHPVVQGLLYVGVLSAFAASGRMAAMWTGVAGFVALRLGLVAAVFGPVVTPMQETLHPLPAADQTLRAILVREALRRGISLPGIDAIEAKVRTFWKRGKK